MQKSSVQYSDDMADESADLVVYELTKMADDMDMFRYIVQAQHWHQNGRLHRDGDQHWHQNGRLHRDGDLPAVITAGGGQEWYQHGKLHRDNDLPAIIEYAFQKWYLHGMIHRDEDLPAVIWFNGTQEWYQYGRRYRANDLPAVIHADGTHEWYYNNELIVDDAQVRKRLKTRGMEENMRKIVLMYVLGILGTNLFVVSRDVGMVICNY